MIGKRGKILTLGEENEYKYGTKAIAVYLPCKIRHELQGLEPR